MRERPSLLTANLGMLLVALLWGAQVPVVNQLAERWDPFFLALVRYLVALPVIWVLLRVFEPGGPALSRGGVVRLFGLGLGTSGFAIFYMLGVAWSNPVTAALIIAGSPIVNGLVAWAIGGARPSSGVLAGLFLVVPGGVIATVDWREGGAALNLSGGEPMILFAIICWGWYSLMAQRWLPNCSQFRITALSVIATLPILIFVYGLALLFGATYRPLDGINRVDLVLFFYLAIGVLVIAVTLWHRGVAIMGLGIASMYLNLVPIVAILIAMVLGVMPRAEQIAGAVLVLAGLVLAQVIDRRGSYREAR